MQLSHSTIRCCNATLQTTKVLLWSPTVVVELKWKHMLWSTGISHLSPVLVIFGLFIYLHQWCQVVVFVQWLPHRTHFSMHVLHHPCLHQCLQFCLHPLLLGDCQLQHHHLFTTTLVWGPILSAHPAATPLSSDIHAARRPKLPLPSWPSPTSHRSWLCWNWWLECCLILLGQLPLLPSEHCWAQRRLVRYLMCLLLLSRPHLNASLREFYKLCCMYSTS